MTCSTDIDEKYKEVIPKDMLDNYAKEVRLVNKKYPSNTPEHTQEMTAIKLEYEKKVKSFTQREYNNAMKDFQAMDRINNAVAEFKSRSGKPLTASQAEDIALGFTEGSINPHSGNKLSSDAHGKAIRMELEQSFYNWAQSHQLENLDTPDDTLKIFQLKEKTRFDPIDLKSVENADPHTKAAMLLRYIEGLKGELFDRHGFPIEQDPYFIAHQTHNSLKITANGFESWFDNMYPLLKKDKPLKDMHENPSMEDVKNVMRTTYDMILKGDFSEFDGHSNINFLDAESFLKYDKMYGTGGASWSQMYGFGIEKASRRLGILQNFGSKPDNVRASIRSRLLEESPSFKDKVKNFDDSYDILRGSIHVEQGKVHKLGSLAIEAHGVALMNISGINALAGDLAAMSSRSSTLMGQGAVESVINSVKGFKYIYDSLMHPVDFKKVARENAVELHDRYKITGGAYLAENRGAVENTLHGYLAKAQIFNGYLNFLDPWTHSSKVYVSEEFAQTLTKDFTKGWDELNTNKKIYYGDFLTKKQFNDIQRAMGGEKVTFMSLNKIIEKAQSYSLPESYRLGEKTMAEKVTINEQTGLITDVKANWRKKRQIQYAQDLKSAVMKLMIDNNNQAIPVSGMKEFRLLGGSKFIGNQYLNLAAKAFRQFKATTFKVFHDTVYQTRVAHRSGGKWYSGGYILGLKGAQGVVTYMVTKALYTYATTGHFPWDDPKKKFDKGEYFLSALNGSGAYGLVGDYMASSVNPRAQAGELMGSMNFEMWKLVNEQSPFQDSSAEVRAAKFGKWAVHNFMPMPIKKDIKTGFEDYFKNYIKEETRQRNPGARSKR
jgi:hypothetical protein